MMFKLGLVFTFVLTSCMADAGYPSARPNALSPYDQGYSYENPGGDQSSGDEISGVAGRDYPIFREVPQTRFECEQQQYPGYYADPEAECQAFHICQRGGRKDSLLCPNGTLFNQARLVCEWWYNVDCSRAQSFYSINEAVAKAMEEADRRIRLAAEEKLSRDYLRESNVDAGHWNQQNIKQGWNDAPTRHNVMSDFAKNLPYEAPATSARSVYGAPEFSAKSNIDDGYWNKYNQQNAKQGWNDTPARHNVMSDFAKNLPYEAPATSARPVYGAPEFSAKSNIDDGYWNKYNQQNAKQGWNDTPARHNVMSDFSKNLPYEAPATSARPVYGAPEFSAKSNVDDGHWNKYNQQNAKQGWNDTPARHNVMSDFSKNLPYEAPATSARPIYGAPEFSAKSNVDDGHWNKYNQQNAKQGWNDTPTQHNVMSDLVKDLPYEAPATSARPVYGAPEVSANSLPNLNNRGDSYSQEQNYMITDTKFGKQTNLAKSNFAEPTNVYLPA